MRELTNIFKNMSLVSQFGLSLITPTLLMLGLCWWLTSSFGLGGWVYIPGFFFGLGGSFTVAYKFYLDHHEEREEAGSGTEGIL